ncbi:MAG: hypothetical protein HYY65_03830 [Candidatus Tectomicrobia bacterium]|uniref:Uncharacterized protein n=1 Tax=Tectimicrobiota bacterium TaxID=2528274 RepID=A0A932LZW5_UNCTE|nr:hypothetical protein [Candidatus Tectomicrobia bacterium]
MATGVAQTPPGTGVLKDGRTGCPHRPRDHPGATFRRHPNVGPPTCTLPRATGQRGYRLRAEGQSPSPLDAAKAAVVG